MKFHLCLLLLLPLLAQAAPGDQRFLAAREAFRNGERIELQTQYGATRATPASDLDPWIEYWYLRQRIDEGQNDLINDFLARQDGSYLAERLRSDWLKNEGRHQRWLLFAAQFPLLRQADQELNCYALQARQSAAQSPSPPPLDEARTLWFTILDLPDSCLPLMKTLVARGRIDTDAIWSRIRLLLENKRYPAAYRTMGFLPGGAPITLKQLEAIAEKPQRHLEHLPANFATSRSGRELALFAWQRLARSEPLIAAKHLQKRQEKLPAGDRAYAWGQIAWQGAQRHLPEALSWYALAGRDKDSRLSTEQMAWQARAALRAHDWSMVRQAISQMPDDMAEQPVWIYWRGRALTEQGRQDEATALYRKISGQPNFYGNLADEELGHTIALPPRASPLTRDELASIQVQPGLKRALALFRLGMRLEGVREWNWTLRDMDDRQLLAAADLARRNGIYDRAIYAADRTQGQHDYALRYPAPFADEVLPHAHRVALDSGWVYGLMRQESRFVVGAQSGVGAKGLMQLMPKTAEWVAKKIGMKDYHPSQVTVTDTNVALGTHYLRMVLADLDNHPVLASAAYNAGPGRARRWRADQPLEGAIYAETIPFEETRDYVKKVMSNAVYYAALFENRPQSLKQRLGTVAARKPDASRVADLP